VSGAKRKPAAEEGAAPDTVVLLALGPIEHDGVRYEEGEKFGVPPGIADRLIAAGAARVAAAD
jgi:hypothetical protein